MNMGVFIRHTAFISSGYRPGRWISESCDYILLFWLGGWACIPINRVCWRQERLTAAPSPWHPVRRHLTVSTGPWRLIMLTLFHTHVGSQKWKVEETVLGCGVSETWGDWVIAVRQVKRATIYHDDWLLMCCTFKKVVFRQWRYFIKIASMWDISFINWLSLVIPYFIFKLSCCTGQIHTALSK